MLDKVVEVDNGGDYDYPSADYDHESEDVDSSEETEEAFTIFLDENNHVYDNK